MPLPRKPYDRWTAEDLDLLVTEPAARESAILDFKKACHVIDSDGKAKQKAQADVIKDVASFANGQGGAILIGVGERKSSGAMVASDIVGVDEAARVEKAITDLVDTYLEPRPAPLRTHRVAMSTGREVLIVEIEQNLHSISMIKFDDLNQFWQRRGTNNRAMSTEEIQTKFAQLAKLRSDGEAFGRSIVDRVRQLAGDTPAIWCAGIPLMRSTDSIPVRPKLVGTLLSKSPRYFELAGLPQEHGWTPYCMLAQLQPRAYGLGLPTTYRGHWDLEIRRDGTLLFVLYPDVRRHNEARQTVEWIPIASVYECLLSTLSLIRDAQDAFSISSSYILLGGVKNTVAVSNDPHRGFLHLVDSPSHDFEPVTVGLGWSPESVFREWAIEFANALGSEFPVPCVPWFPVRG